MDFEVFETKERVLADNDRAAAETRAAMAAQGTYLINLMGSPGAGKTSVLLRLIDALKDRYRIGVMEADADSDVDARTVSETGVKVIQLHTGGLCHMDADMTARGLARLGTEGLDLIILENVGNLVCPAEFDVGADLRLTILSVPEGDDKPLKYPLMFTVADVLVVNKIDTAPIFDFDLAAARERAAALHPGQECYPVSALQNEGFGPLIDALVRRIDARVKAGKEDAE